MKYKILFVDDDKALIKMLSQYFLIKGYEIRAALSGLEAIEKVKEKPDIILLDINMPGMDGVEVCKKIRDKISSPIIFLTAKVEEPDRINGLLSGGDDYIVKPFSLKELEARVVAHLKREERHRNEAVYRFYKGLIIDYSEKKVQIENQIVPFTKKGFSIRKTIVLYIFITLIVSYILSYFVIHQARWEQQGVWQKYMEGVSIKERPNQLEMSDKDRWISELCDFLQTYSILLITSVGVVFAVCLFYKNKLQDPLKELSKASEEIGNNNLDFKRNCVKSPLL